MADGGKYTVNLYTLEWLTSDSLAYFTTTLFSYCHTAGFIIVFLGLVIYTGHTSPYRMK